MKPYDQTLSEIYSESALRAMNWAEEEYARRKPEIVQKVGQNPSMWQALVQSEDYRNLAALELYKLTKDSKWNTIFKQTSKFTSGKNYLFLWESHDQRNAAYSYVLMDKNLQEPEILKNIIDSIKEAAQFSLEFQEGNSFYLTSHTDKDIPPFVQFYSTPGSVNLAVMHYITGEDKFLKGVIKSAYFTSGANPSNMTYTTGLGNGPRDILHLDYLNANKGIPKGITTYGNYDPDIYRTWNTGYWIFETLGDVWYPNLKSWPGNEAHVDICPSAMTSEWTIHQTMGETAFTYGYLAFADLKQNNYDAGNGNNTGNANVPTPTVMYIEDDINGKNVMITAKINAIKDAFQDIDKVVIDNIIIDNLVSKIEGVLEKGKNPNIQLKINTSKNPQSIEVKFTKDSFSKIKQHMKLGTYLRISNELAEIDFDSKCIEEIVDKIGGNTITIKIQTNTNASSESAIKNIEERRHMVNICLVSEDKQFEYFKQRGVNVSIPYMPGTEEKSFAIVVYSINKDNSYKALNNRYDPKTQTIYFKTNNLSSFIIGYKEISFDDVKFGSSYYDAVGYLAARDITTGTSNGKFSPDANLTRAQAITLILRAFGIEPKAIAEEENFKDAGNNIYTGYIAAAKKLGIAKGTGNNLFMPDKIATLEEISAILYNVLIITNEMPEQDMGILDLNYSIIQKTCPWAKKAIEMLMSVGIFKDYSEFTEPKKNIKRGEAAQIIYNLLNR